MMPPYWLVPFSVGYRSACKQHSAQPRLLYHWQSVQRLSVCETLPGPGEAQHNKRAVDMLAPQQSNQKVYRLQVLPGCFSWCLDA